MAEPVQILLTTFLGVARLTCDSHDEQLLLGEWPAPMDEAAEVELRATVLRHHAEAHPTETETEA